MPSLHLQIEELTLPQVKALLVILVKKYGTDENNPTISSRLIEHLNQEENANFTRLIVHSLIEQEKIGQYAQEQLLNNKIYFAQLTSEEQYRSIEETLPYLITAIALLGSRISIKVKDGKIEKFELATGLMAIPTIAAIFKNLPPTLNGKNIFINPTISGRDIHIGDNATTNNYDAVGQVFTIHENKGDFNFFQSSSDSQVLQEIQQLKKSLDTGKQELIHQLSLSNKQLEKSLIQAVQQLSEEQQAMVKEGLSDLNSLGFREIENILEAISEAVATLSPELQEASKNLQQLLVSNEKINTKLRVAIPFLPFVSILHEYDAQNPLHQWWKKIRNIVF